MGSSRGGATLRRRRPSSGTLEAPWDAGSAPAPPPNAPSTARRSALVLAALATGLLAACGSDRGAGPRWIALAASAGPERVVVDSLSGDGVAPPPGEGVSCTREVPAGSVLRLRTVVGAPPRAEVSGSARFEVRLDGDPLLDFEARHTAGDTPKDDHHELTLPAGEYRFTLRIETEDPGLQAAFLEPTIGPARIGGYGERPWGERTRPDVLLFVADTFRADNLEAYGGDPEVAPALNAIVERSRRFLEARSPSVWTLPAHASMFTGLFPLQHGALEKELALANDFETLAERFQDAGYRTGAVTDGVFLSRNYHLDQGFGSFLEHDHPRHSLARTLAEADAFLRRDDGRPVFLFVHTYRTHAPYRVGATESTAELEKLERQTAAVLSGTEGAERIAILKEASARHLALYRSGVTALDEAVGPWIEGLEASGWLENAVLVFTSDHGEEFLEHGRRRHGGKPHDEKARVPLFLLGERIEPGAVTFGATLSDLPPTLARLAGLPWDPRWIGTDLLGLDRDRTLFAYNGDRHRDGHLAAVRAKRKVFAHVATQALAEGRVDEAFDLARDPGEQENVVGRADWPAELAREAAPAWETLERPLTSETPEAVLDEAALEDLDALGYVE